MSYIKCTARYIPKNKILNEDLLQFPERNRQLIGEKAGIYCRYHADETQCTSDIGARAVTNLIEKFNIQRNNIGAVICATSSPDRIQPATATRIQELCELNTAFAFDINSVCSGSIYALAIADALVQSGIDNVIVVASEVYSKILNHNDIRTFPYFGDGAAAALISRDGNIKIKGFELGSDGSGADIIQIPAGGTMLPLTKIAKESDMFFKMNGQAVFHFACEKGSYLIDKLINTYSKVPLQIIPHQANINILKEISLRTKTPFEIYYINLDRLGNTAGASVLIALDEYIENNTKTGFIFLAAFGGGLSWGSSCLEVN